MVLILALLVVLLVLPLVVPIGPMYWDTYIYLDAAQRIDTGQIPSVDFFTPAGPLGYYLFAWGLNVFSYAQPMLLAQWSTLIVAAPLMAVVLADVDRQSRSTAFALLIPFLIFAISPANAQFETSFPGLDGFGIYNRQVCLLLYVLVAGLIFIPNGRKLALLCAATMLCLFLTKITGFLVGGLFGFTALLAGRISVINALIAIVAALVVLAGLELNGHMISAYLADIGQLLVLNEAALLPRFLTVISGKLDVILPAGVLVLVLFLLETRHNITPTRFFDRGSVWLAITVVGGVFVETQNTGSQEFIFLWPVLLMIWQRIKPLSDNKIKMTVLILTAFIAVPTVSKVGHKVLRAIAVAPTYVQPPVTELKNMAQVSTRADMMERAKLLPQHYADYSAPYEALARLGQLPSWRLYSELDYQIYWLISVDEAVKALKKFEKENSIQLKTLMTLDFTDPFPWLLNREATRKIQIGADPFRTVGAMTPETRAAVEATDGILRPKCPMTTSRLALQEIYADALKDRDVVALDPCWDLLLRPGILKQ
ncbi:hypothetical protein [Brucella pituitosa]|uniref:hypothetical protein n=1 Tax=Brucella pituitosa TaxID=571256 RepID=UPI001FFDE727|nr:hypothetical protein [Brucella pituitosa]